MTKLFQDDLIKGMLDIGVEIEKIYGSPQDIEGSYYNKEFYVVQTREQMVC